MRGVIIGRLAEGDVPTLLRVGLLAIVLSSLKRGRAPSASVIESVCGVALFVRLNVVWIIVSREHLYYFVPITMQ